MMFTNPEKAGLSLLMFLFCLGGCFPQAPSLIDRPYTPIYINGLSASITGGDGCENVDIPKKYNGDADCKMAVGTSVSCIIDLRINNASIHPVIANKGFYFGDTDFTLVDTAGKPVELTDAGNSLAHQKYILHPGEDHIEPGATCQESYDLATAFRLKAGCIYSLKIRRHVFLDGLDSKARQEEYAVDSGLLLVACIK